LNILSSITSPEDIKALDKELLPQLCQEIREFLIKSISKTGGHLSSNLGAVELTVAIHRVYDTSRDRLVFDVGHQSYVHKLLTGRRESFGTLRSLGGIAGFPKPVESVHDAFIAGHASNSVSVALGMARARTRQGQDYNVVALIGDGALTGGLAYEGLSDAGESGEPLVVILNDNGMSINPNVGGISKLLARQRVKPGYLSFKRTYRRIVGKIPPLYRFLHKIKERIKDILLPETMFEQMGFIYLGPVDGHDIFQMESVLRWARELKCPVLVHAKTQKGRGYSFAEENPEACHGVSPFDPEKGIPENGDECFSTVFGEALKSLALKDESICAITAAMESGTGLTAFAREFPGRFFDVGIAEGHAVSMAAGMAKQGVKPVVAVYSSFLQRSYDMLIHDVSLQRLHVVLAVDRAGLVGQDGETHHGVFDVNYFCSVPHMAVLCPSSFAELRDMLELALYRISGPAAVRYPRGGEGMYKDSTAKLPAVKLREGTDITIVSYGILINQALAAAEMLLERGITAEVVKLNLINPLDEKTVLASLERTGRLLVAEDACSAGSVGGRLMSAVAASGLVLQGARLLNLGSGIVTHGTVEELLGLNSLDARGLVAAALELVGENGVQDEESQA
jgi:1-deoxy-D-xylulose-5-phosphate synthase